LISYVLKNDEILFFLLDIVRPIIFLLLCLRVVPKSVGSRAGP